MIFLDQISRYFDPFALSIVVGGTLLTTAARSTVADLGRAWRSLGLLFTADPEADARAARVSVNRIRELAEIRNVSCADRVETAQRFLVRAARALSDARSSLEFSRWASDEIESRRSRDRATIDVWRGMADTAPAMGMIGTIIGLIQMFAAMDDPARVGPAMAIAMLTTLYGITLSAAIAGPIASRLERLSAAKLDWQAAALKQFELIARAEFDAAPVKLKPVLRNVV
jgi:chemotaxis protein MotA